MVTDIKVWDIRLLISLLTTDKTMIKFNIEVDELEFYRTYLALYSATQKDKERKLAHYQIKFLADLMYHDIEYHTYRKLRETIQGKSGLSYTAYRKNIQRLNAAGLIIRHQNGDYDLHPTLSLLKNYIKNKKPKELDINIFLKLNHKELESAAVI